MAKVKIQGHASGTGVLTVTAPDTDVNRTITLPDATGTLATTADVNAFDPDGAVTINDTGADVDFRVESDTDANAFFVDGATGNIGFGTNSPGRTSDRQAGDFLTVYGTGTNGSILELVGSSDTDNTTLGILSFVNAANANNADDEVRLIAQIRTRVETDDSNAGNDSGGNLVFQTKADGGIIDDRLEITADGRGLSQFTAKAWIYMEWNATILDSHNFSSVTDNGTGDHTVNFSNNMPYILYTAFANVTSGTATFAYTLTKAVGSVKVRTAEHDGTLRDEAINVVIFGD
jgi:hypothetical protein